MTILSGLLNVAIGLTVVTTCYASPVTSIHRRGKIASDEIVGFPQTVPSGTTGDIYLAYQPRLKVVNGCVPFPAVDAQGNTK